MTGASNKSNVTEMISPENGNGDSYNVDTGEPAFRPTLNAVGPCVNGTLIGNR